MIANAELAQGTAERRAWVRQRCSLPMTVKTVEQVGASRWPARSCDVSAGGLGMVLERRFEPAQRTAHEEERRQNAARRAGAERDAPDDRLHEQRPHDDPPRDVALQEGADHVVAVRAEAVDDHPPGERARHEHAAVGREDPAEVRVGLQGGDEAVEAQRDHAGADPQPAAVFPVQGRRLCSGGGAASIMGKALRRRK